MPITPREIINLAAEHVPQSNYDTINFNQLCAIDKFLWFLLLPIVKQLCLSASFSIAPTLRSSQSSTLLTETNKPLISSLLFWSYTQGCKLGTKVQLTSMDTGRCTQNWETKKSNLEDCPSNAAVPDRNSGKSLVNLCTVLKGNFAKILLETLQ